MRREVCEFRWLHIRYEEVRDLLRDRLVALLRPAATAGSRRGDETLSTLAADLGGLHLERDIAVEVGRYEELGPPFPIVRYPVRWHDAAHPGLYPIMEGVLEAYPITGNRTQISVQGGYRPPLGPVGAAVDVLVLHRVADSAVEHFLEAFTQRVEAAWHDGRRDPPTPPRALSEPERTGG